MELRNRVNNKRYENFFMVKWCNTIISTEFLLIFQRAVKGDGDGEERDAGIDHRRRRLSLSLFLCLFLLLRRLRLTFLHFLMDSCWSIRKTINNPFATGIMSSNWNIKYLSRPKRGPPTLFWPTFFPSSSSLSAFSSCSFYLNFAYLSIMNYFIAALLFSYLCFYGWFRLMRTRNSLPFASISVLHTRARVCVSYFPDYASVCLSNGVDRLWIIAVISCAKM